MAEPETMTLYIEEVTDDDEDAPADTASGAATEAIAGEAEMGGQEDGVEEATGPWQVKTVQFATTPSASGSDASSVAPAARGGAAIVALDAVSTTGAATTSDEHRLVVFGGVNRTQTHFGAISIATIGPQTGTWARQTCTGTAPAPRTGHAAVHYAGRMWVFGGINFTDQAVYDDVFSLDTATWEWRTHTLAGDAQPIGRNSHTVSLLGSFAVMVAGASPFEGPLNDVHIMNLEQEPLSWEAKGDAPFSKREMHTATVARPCPIGGAAGGTSGATSASPAATDATECIYIVGGREEDGTVSDEVYMLCLERTDNTTSVHFHQLNPLPAPRCSHASALIGSEESPSICAYGGFAGMESMVLPTDLAIFRVETGTWSSVNPSMSIEGCFGHCACSFLIPHVPPPEDSTAEEAEASTAASRSEHVMTVFGGVNPTQDLNSVLTIRE